MIYFSFSNSLQMQYDGLMTNQRGVFVSKEIYLLDGNLLIALGRPYSVCISVKDGAINEERSYEDWDGIREIEDGEPPVISEELFMGELMRYVLMSLRRVLKVEPYANEFMLSVLRGKLNEKLKYYNSSTEADDSSFSFMKNGESVSLEEMLKTVSEPSLYGDVLSDMDFAYSARLMGLNRYEEALKLYKAAGEKVDDGTIIGTQINMALGEIYYFLDDLKASVNCYKRCDRRFIKDLRDYRVRLGHSLLDGTTGDKEAEIKMYYRGLLNPTYKKSVLEEYERIEPLVKPSYEKYEKYCIDAAKKEGI
ncbi:MAG: hypothetical protein K6E53_16080 [Lachnospiraceae bacterium]|nr:hypothetical protein [Lachnospiraceae bacterium]